tara:strand:+ start:252 stop:671 length:420 start_codon:yes stop_codon:yes gene_type:complete
MKTINQSQTEKNTNQVNIIYDKVKDILHTEPATRNSDAYLCFKYYQETIPEFRPSIGKPMTVNDFFELLHNKQIKSFSSITRAKRLVMENYPELRGSNYKYKQKMAGKMKTYIINKKNDIRQIKSAENVLNGGNRESIR